MAELNSFLTGIANAIRSKKGTTDKINASNFASEIESIESGSGGGGIIEVDELPTNPQEGVIYQVNEVSDIDVYLKDDGSLPINLNDVIRIGLGITPTLIYEVVDSLPSTPNVSNLQTFSPAYIYIQNDIPYIYGNAGYGNMWLDVKTLIEIVTNLTYENKGYVANTDEILETGLYVTYKKGKQGISVIRGYDTLINENGWNDFDAYKKIFNKTIEKYSNNSIEIIPTHAFRDCSNLKTVSFPNVHTINIWAFAGTGIERLDDSSFPKLDIISQEAFVWCEYLESVNLSNVTYIEQGVFLDCPQLKEVRLPLLVSVSPKAFMDCPKLDTVYIQNATNIREYAFSGCRYLTDLKMNLIKTISNNAFESCYSLISLDLPYIDYIGDNAFKSCGLQYISLNESTTSIGEYAFCSCLNLIEIAIPKKLSILQRGLFKGCTSLKTVVFESDSELRQISLEVFYKCRSLTSISIPESVEEIRNYAFEYCENLTTVTLKGEIPPILGWDVFDYCTNLTEIKVPISSVDAYKSATNWSVYADKIVGY